MYKKIRGGILPNEKEKKSKKRKQHNYERFVRFVLHLCSNAPPAFGMDVYQFVQAEQ